MKKTAFTLAVLVFLSLCLLISAGAIIGGTATDVSFTLENVVGDPAAAEGFSIQSFFTLEGHAHWDTTLTLGKNPTWNTDFRYTTFSKTRSGPMEPYMDFYAITDFSMRSYGILDPSQVPELKPYASVLRELAQEAPANAEEYTKTIPLSDVMDYLPLSLNIISDKMLYTSPDDDNGFFTRYFHIPAEGYRVQLSVDTDADKNLIGAFLTILDAPSISSPVIRTEDALFFAFGAETPISGSAPFGVYRIPISDSDRSYGLKPNQTELVLPMEGNFTEPVLVENDGKLFVLAGIPEGGSQGLWMDTATGEVLYTFQDPEDYSGATVFADGDHVVILSQLNEEAIPRRASVWAKDADGQYRKTIDADISQAAFSDCRSIRTLYDEAQNRLLIATFLNTYVSPSLQVAVCQENAMTYAATFISSQDKLRKTTFIQPEEEFPLLHLAQAQ